MFMNYYVYAIQPYSLLTKYCTRLLFQILNFLKNAKTQLFVGIRNRSPRIHYIYNTVKEPPPTWNYTINIKMKSKYYFSHTLRWSMNMIIHKEIFICLNIFNVDGRDCTVYIRCTLYNLLHIIQYSQY